MEPSGKKRRKKKHTAKLNMLTIWETQALKTLNLWTQKLRIADIMDNEV